MEHDNVYTLAIYSINKDPHLKLDPTHVVAFIEQCGQPCGEHITFKAGTVFKFFECFKETSGLDILALVGGGIVGGNYPQESELCCGGLEAEVTLATAAKCKYITTNEEELKKAKETAKSKGLDPDWFINTVQKLGEAFEERLHKGGETLALFE
eukprot:TRINITY_DN6946_c0_g2_i1.p1 TRINITY_DN6946_c0_g2~~TRINITY_DN6946_c0_g2_i1.p1  ORF type:complete len:154 (+),score=28.15 TRINITY_DN6946_c0_g2_i1:65-526(+)